MKTKLINFDPRDYLKDNMDCKYALEAAFQEDPGDGSLIAATLGDIAKARGMTQLAKEVGQSKESLYRSLSGKGHPKFSTILKVSRALGFSLVLQK